MERKTRLTMHRIFQVCIVLLAGLLSFAVTLFGMYSAVAIDVHFNAMLSILYCVLAILSLPVFLLALAFRKLIALQAILAIAYLAVYSALNWRTCAALGYCSSIASTVLATLKTRSALAFFAAAFLSIAATLVSRKQPALQRAEK